MICALTTCRFFAGVQFNLDFFVDAFLNSFLKFRLQAQASSTDIEAKALSIESGLLLLSAREIFG